MITAVETAGFADLSITARPPRVAVVIPGDERWSYWSRRALYQARLLWGGCDVALIPHHDGEVHPVLMRGCRAYDPDYVVDLRSSISERRAILGADRAAPDQPGFDEDRPFADDATLHAAKTVALGTSVYRQRINDEMWSPQECPFPPTGTGGPLSPAHLGGEDPHMGIVLRCPASWDGPLAAAVASRSGVVDPPDYVGVEPNFDADDIDKISAWLLDEPVTDLPAVMVQYPTIEMSMQTSHMKTAAEPTPDQALIHVQQGGGLGVTGLIVRGSSADDMALARLWRLVFGAGWWLPNEVSTDDAVTWRTDGALSRLRREAKQRAGRLLQVSLSRAATTIPVPGVTGDEDDWLYRVEIQATSEEDLPWNQPTRRYLVAQGQFDLPLTVPVIQYDDGSRTMSSPLPPQPLLAPSLVGREDLQWQVDVTWKEGSGVRDRSLDARSLQSPCTEVAEAWVRPSRDGISLASQRHGLVINGVLPVNNLARPRLVDLGLAAWVKAKAREQDTETEPSDAGLRSQLLARRLGSRAAFVATFSGPMRPAFRLMANASPDTRDSFSDGQGVSLAAGRGLVHFQGFQQLATPLEVKTLRDTLDDLLEAEVLRRGLILRCNECGQKQFVAVDHLRQRWLCTFCESTTSLNSSAWRKPLEEPLWFYDLHPAGRRMIKANGDVCALAAAHLGMRAVVDGRPMHSTEELAFRQNGKTLYEIDMISYDGQVLSVVECKSSSSLKDAKAKAREVVLKRCRAATLLEADQVVFATTAPVWDPGTRHEIDAAVRSIHEWPTRGRPTMRLISNLGFTPPGMVLDELL